MDELANCLTMELIPAGPEERYKRIAQAIGVENFYKLCLAVGGEMVYVPLVESITRPVRNAKIKEEYNGRNRRELAAKYGVTERRIRSLCAGKNVKEQLSLFDEDVLPREE